MNGSVQARLHLLLNALNPVWLSLIYFCKVSNRYAKLETCHKRHPGVVAVNGCSTNYWLRVAEYKCKTLFRFSFFILPQTLED